MAGDARDPRPRWAGLDGRVALVTGAGQGLGRAYATELARAGAAVAVNDVVESAASEVAMEIAAGGGRALAVAGDVAAPGRADAIVDAVVGELGDLHILVNNAGIVRPAMLWNMTDEQWDEVIRVNQTGVFRCLRAAARHMRSRGYGRIVNVTSAAGIDGSIGQINYAATKAAIIGMTKSAARELAGAGITVNAIAPVAATPMTERVRTDPRLFAKVMPRLPMARYAEAGEVAPSVVFLASDAASYTTGHVLLADGGMSM